MKNDKYIRIISLILSFVISIAFTVAGYAFSIYFSFFTISSIEASMFKTDYYTAAYESFKTDITDLLIPTGFPEDMLSDILSSADMKDAISTYVRSKISRELIKTDTETVKEEVRAGIEEYIKAEGIEETKTLKGVVDEIVKYAAESYKENVENKWFKYLGSAKVKVRHYILVYVLPLMILMVLSIAALFKIQKWKHRGFRYIVYSSTVAAILTAAGPLALEYSGIYKRLSIQPEYFYNFAMCFIETGVRNTYIIAGAWVVITIIALLSVKLAKANFKKRSKVKSK